MYDSHCIPTILKRTQYSYYTLILNAYTRFGKNRNKRNKKSDDEMNSIERKRSILCCDGRLRKREACDAREHY